MGQSPSIPSEHARLIFSSNSLRNTQIECDALGLHYQLSTPSEGIKNQRSTSITRWDPRQEKDVLIAEWERKIFGRDRIRMASNNNNQLISEEYKSEDGYVVVNDLLQRTYGLPGGVRVNRTFTANNGRRYTWKTRHTSLKLYEEGSQVPIAEYGGRHCLINKRKAHIRLAPGCDEILDYLVVTCVITERQRRDAKRRQRSNSGGGGGV
ncbi:hypothetical protein ACEPAI_9925 [Sanghuangporus weigelae]